MRSKAKWALALALCVVGAASPAPQQWTPDCDVLRDVYLAARVRAEVVNLKAWIIDWGCVMRGNKCDGGRPAKQVRRRSM